MHDNIVATGQTPSQRDIIIQKIGELYRSTQDALLWIDVRVCQQDKESLERFLAKINVLLTKKFLLEKLLNHFGSNQEAQPAELFESYFGELASEYESNYLYFILFESETPDAGVYHDLYAEFMEFI